MLRSVWEWLLEWLSAAGPAGEPSGASMALDWSDEHWSPEDRVRSARALGGHEPCGYALGEWVSTLQQFVDYP